MRSIAILLASLLALAAGAQSWELGSTELWPVYGTRSMLAATASSRVHLTTWVDQEAELLFAARHASSGEVLDPAGLFIGRNDYFARPRIASAGDDFLIAWRTDRAELRTTRITADGEVIHSNWSVPHGTPFALGSNGRAYLLVYASGSRGPNAAVLLDRDGAPMSGTLTLPTAFEYSVASRNGAWFLASGRLDERLGWQWRSAELAESDFPRRTGESRPLALEPMFPEERPSKVAVAATARGFLSARATFKNWSRTEIALRWHAAAERPHERGDSDFRFEVAADVDHLAVAVDGAAVYVAYGAPQQTSGIVRVEHRAVHELVPAIREGVAVSVSGLGAAAFWIDAEDQQVYSARIAGTALAAPPQHVSKRLAGHADSMLLSAAGVHLALWRDLGSRPQLAYTILSDEGEPLTPQLGLGAYPTTFGAATDGHSFFVLWLDGGWRGCVIAPDGTLVRPPFDVRLNAWESVDSFVWDGTSYVAGLRGGTVARISADGAVRERVRVTENRDDTIELLPVEDGALALVVRTYGNGCLCGFYLDIRALPLDRDLRPDESREERWRGRAWTWHTWLGYAAYGAGSGHRLLIRANSEDELEAIGDDGEARALPYGGYGPSVRWNGGEFLVATSSVLARHRPDGTFRDSTPMPPGTLAASVAVDRNRVPIVLTERLVGRTRRLLVTRLRTASAESAPATR